MERRGWSYRERDGQAFGVDNQRLKVFRIFSNHVYEVRDEYLRTNVRLWGNEISEEEACSISRFDGDLESALKDAA